MEDSTNYNYLRELVIECGEISQKNGFWDLPEKLHCLHEQEKYENWYTHKDAKAQILFQKLGLILTELGELYEAYKIDDNNEHAIEEAWDIFIRLADLIAHVNQIKYGDPYPEEFHKMISENELEFLCVEDVCLTLLMIIAQEMENARAYKEVCLERIMVTSISAIKFIEGIDSFDKSGIKKKIDINKTRPYKHNKAF